MGAFVGAGHIVGGAITAYGFGGGTSVFGVGSGMATGAYNIKRNRE